MFVASFHHVSTGLGLALWTTPASLTAMHACTGSRVYLVLGNDSFQSGSSALQNRHERSSLHAGRRVILETDAGRFAASTHCLPADWSCHLARHCLCTKRGQEHGCESSMRSPSSKQM